VDKSILVISPQPWGKMLVSKHHYALELARRGNRVWFLEPPRQQGSAKLGVRRIEGQPNLRVLSRRTFIPDLLRFKAKRFYALAVALEIAALRRALDVELDVVWSFEPNLYPNLRLFGGKHRIYHPVDMVSGTNQLAPAKSADLVLSVAPNILDRLATVTNHRHLIQHGLGADFVQAASRLGSPWKPRPLPPRIGYVGNLFIQQLDRPIFETVVRENPDVEFHIWGPRAPAESNLGAQAAPGTDAFVRFLGQAANVQMRGAVDPAELAPALHDMDAFLLCYDPRRDPAAGANSHKILEYLSTGRVVIGNHVSTYADRTGWLRMARPHDNAELPTIFRDTLADLASHNSAALHTSRVAFALDQSYARQVERIESLLYSAEAPPPKAPAPPLSVREIS